MVKNQIVLLTSTLYFTICFFSIRYHCTGRPDPTDIVSESSSSLLTSTDTVRHLKHRIATHTSFHRHHHHYLRHLIAYPCFPRPSQDSLVQCSFPISASSPAWHALTIHCYYRYSLFLLCLNQISSFCNHCLTSLSAKLLGHHCLEILLRSQRRCLHHRHPHLHH